MTVGQMTIDELKALIRDTVEQKLQELLGDPGADLTLREAVEARLRRTLEQTRQGEAGVHLPQVLRDTRLRWE